VRDARVVALSGSVKAVRDALAAGTLHAWASRQAGTLALAGRGPAWTATLANRAEVVVRHSRHGGAFARVTGDLFLSPTRAPRELATALRLAAAGVPTPEVVAYAVYPATWPFARADVVTRRLRGSDFPGAWRAAPDASARHTMIRALAMLLQQLQKAGARHPDLNLTNVLLVVSDDEPTAFVLDVDRVAFGEPGGRQIGARNLERLLRSSRKWRERWGVDLEDAASLATLSRSLDDPRLRALG
jgi:3-deoxy-D-manno-octulosonic acid kinase